MIFILLLILLFPTRVLAQVIAEPVVEEVLPKGDYQGKVDVPLTINKDATEVKFVLDRTGFGVDLTKIIFIEILESFDAGKTNNLLCGATVQSGSLLKPLRPGSPSKPTIATESVVTCSLIPTTNTRFLSATVIVKTNTGKRDKEGKRDPTQEVDTVLNTKVDVVSK